MENLGLDGRIILKLIIWMEIGTYCSRFIWKRIREMLGS